MKKKTAKGIVIVTAIAVLIILGIVLTINMSRKEDESGSIKQNVNEKFAQDEEYVSIGEDGTKVNISKKIKEEKVVEELKITDMEIIEVDNVSTIVANVKNETGKEKGEYSIEIKLIDKKGKEIATVPGYIGKIKAGGNMALTVSATDDFVNAYDYEIKKK